MEFPLRKKSTNVVSQSSRTCCISLRNCNSLSIDKPMKYLWQKLQDDSEKEQSIMCSTYKRALRSITISFLKVQFARKKKVLTLTNTR